MKITPPTVPPTMAPMGTLLEEVDLLVPVPDPLELDPDPPEEVDPDPEPELELEVGLDPPVLVGKKPPALFEVAAALLPPDPAGVVIATKGISREDMLYKKELSPEFVTPLGVTNPFPALQ